MNKKLNVLKGCKTEKAPPPQQEGETSVVSKGM